MELFFGSCICYKLILLFLLIKLVEHDTRFNNNEKNSIPSGYGEGKIATR